MIDDLMGLDSLFCMHLHPAQPSCWLPPAQRDKQGVECCQWRCECQTAPSLSPVPPLPPHPFIQWHAGYMDRGQCAASIRLPPTPVPLFPTRRVKQRPMRCFLPFCCLITHASTPPAHPAAPVIPPAPSDSRAQAHSHLLHACAGVSIAWDAWGAAS